jgi:hypothetical protein
MSVQVQIKISGDAEDYLKKMSDKGTVLPALARTIDQQNLLTVSLIQRDYLSFPSGGPATPLGLRFQSGRYRNSLRATRANFIGGDVVSGIGTNAVSAGGVSYPAIHEFGAEIPSRPTRSKNKSYAKKHPFTKAYEFPARAPIQRGIDDRSDDYADALGKTIFAL